MKAYQYHSEHVGNFKVDSPEQSVEKQTTVVLNGAGWGFLQGIIRGWIWPIHAVALMFVFGYKRYDMRVRGGRVWYNNNPSQIVMKKEEKKEEK